MLISLIYGDIFLALFCIITIIIIIIFVIFFFACSKY